MRLMSDVFQRIRDALRNGTLAGVPAEDFSDPLDVRLVRALSNRERSGPAPGAADIASLVGHFLARESARAGSPQTLDVPHDPLWPSADAWERAGLQVLNLPDRRVLRSQPWIPTWLPHSGVVRPGGAAFREVARRSYGEVPGDPCLQVTGRENYLCAGQREAVRAVLSMPRAATLVVNLPTGAGKSLCAHVPALLEPEDSSLTIVVVPTTALAIDQESSITPWVGHHTAFFATAGMDDGRRVGILQRLARGTQRVVFTSPEALLGVLRSAVYRSAREGTLRYLVIDEAHMIEQWGDEFRSSFQELAGLRSDLLRHCPARGEFRTLLLTATLTPECRATLRAHFGVAASAFQMLSSVQLRPEPEYWIALAESEDERERWVLEAIHRLPRSLILYVTQPWRAEQWKQRLRALGFHRCESVTGRTRSADRERVIRQWRERETDIVVATSAFGLGMDQSDVRAVIHACVPESIDRYYQEVGRGGRDGTASVSLTVYTRDDIQAARRLNRSTIIGIARGHDRWMRMFSDPRKVSLGSGRYRVPVDVVPSLLAGDIDMVNDYNVAWNVRTLTLMSRAGLIAMDCEPPEERAPEVGSDDSDSAPSLVRNAQTRVVRILDGQHGDEEVWRQRVKPARHQTAARDRRTYELMLEVLSGSTCVSGLFEEAYTIYEEPESGVAGRRVRVSRSCGGCPWCRENGHDPFAGEMPVPPPVWHPQTEVGPGLSTLLRGESAAVFYPPAADRSLNRLVDWLVSQGCRSLVGPDDWVVRWRAHFGGRRGANSPFVTRLCEYDAHTAPRVPSLITVDPRSPVPNHLLPQDDAVVPHVVLLPEGARDTSRPGRLLRDVVPLRRFALEEFKSLVSL